MKIDNLICNVSFFKIRSDVQTTTTVVETKNVWLMKLYVMAKMTVETIVMKMKAVSVFEMTKIYT